MESIGPLLTIIGSVILVLLKAWQDGNPARLQEVSNEKRQQGRQDINNGNVSAVESRIDSVLTVSAGTADSGSVRLGDDADTARRLAEITSS